MQRAVLFQLLIAQQLAIHGATVCLAQSPNGAEGQRADIAREIRKTVEDLQALRQEQRREKESQQAQMEQIRRQIELLQQELNPVEEAAKNQRQEISRLEDEIAKQENLAANARAWINQAADKVQPLAVETRRRVHNGVGEQKLRRLTEFSKAVELLGSEELLERVEGIRGFFRGLGDEWLAARSVTLSNEPVFSESGQEMAHAWVVGFGLVTKAFTSEDGQRTGISSSDPDSDWKLDLPTDVKQQVRELVEVVREQRPPAVTPLHVTTLPPDN